MAVSKNLKVFWSSDLHLENSNFDKHSLISSGILILIGDISADFSLLDSFFRKVNPNVNVVYIPGNHEFEAKTIQEVVPYLKDFLSIYPNVRVLNNESCVIEGVKIIGSTLWTNFEISDNQIRKDVLERVDAQFPEFNSTVIIGDNGKGRRFTVLDAVDLFNESVKFLEFELKHNRSKLPTIVATHFTPSHRSTHPRFKDDAMNAYWSNQLDHLIPLADYWLHGHTHDSHEYYVDNCFVGCNPRGNSKLMNLASNPKFDILKHIEIS